MSALPFKYLTVSLLMLGASCSGSGDGNGGGGGITGPEPTRSVTWVDNTWTQPVPSWGSPVRLNLPVPLDSIVLGPAGGLGAYGAHEGEHAEGLDHVWIPITNGRVVNSWAAGTVTKIEDMGAGEYYVTVDYGQGLIGKHQDVSRPLVSVGQTVKEGEPVAIGNSAEFMLLDNNRTDGERTGGSVGAMVSPYDYLRSEVKTALVQRIQNEVVAPYFTRGLSSGNYNPWEPLLTNKMLFHDEHRGTIDGEWILTNKGWTSADPVYYEVMTFLEVTNTYGHFQHAEFEDAPQGVGGKTEDDATWQLGSLPGQIMISMTHFGTYYGLFAVDESSGRARLSIEWQRGSYPATITSNAAVYVERTPIYLGGDAQALGLIK